MKVQIIYSSLSGCTKRVAEGLYNGIKADEKSIHDLKDGAPKLDGDVILMGYWVDKGGPNEEMKNFLPTVEGKNVGIFCTLGFWADSTHAQGSLHQGVELVKEKNTVLGGYVCNGTLSPKIIESFRQNKNGGPHSATPASEARWELMKDHPTKAEIDLCVERFNERIEYLKMLEKVNTPYVTINI